MKTLDRQKLDVVHQTWSDPALRDWRGHFPPEFVAALCGARLRPTDQPLQRPSGEAHSILPPASLRPSCRDWLAAQSRAFPGFLRFSWAFERRVAHK
jgi:hypothetical protein